MIWLQRSYAGANEVIRWRRSRPITHKPRPDAPDIQPASVRVYELHNIRLRHHNRHKRRGTHRNTHRGRNRNSRHKDRRRQDPVLSRNLHRAIRGRSPRHASHRHHGIHRRGIRRHRARRHPAPMRLSARPARLRQRSPDQTPICVTSTTLRHGSPSAPPFLDR